MQRITKHKDGRVEVETINNEPSLTQQQFKDHVDINNIMAKYSQTGQFPPGLERNSVFADVSEITDYHDSVNKVQAANDAFMLLPAEIRNRFGNDPGQLLGFLQDPKNYEEAVRLGIYEKPKVTQQNDGEKNNETQNAKNNANETTVTIKP